VTFEYNLVVIGGTTAGRRAAMAAVRRQSRVALVEPPIGKIWLGAGSIYSQTLNQAAQLFQQLPPGGISRGEESASGNLPIPAGQFSDPWEYAHAVADNWAEENSLAVLAAEGVDVIMGSGEFCRLPHLAFNVNQRQLRSRAYLIASAARPAIPEIPGLAETGYMTAADLWQKPLLKQANLSWAIIGGSPIGIELAQALARLGGNITLIVKGDRLLSNEDSEAAQLIQAQLEADGVKVITRSQVTHAKRIEGKRWVLAGDSALEVDQILVAAGQTPDIQSLNLDGVGVKYHQRGIIVNSKLQTTNPQIYACGDFLGGYQFSQVAEYEAGIAVKNALFFPVFSVDYGAIPRAIFSEPPLARVGMTEAEARKQYGKDVLVLRQYFKSAIKGQILGATTGLCKIIVRSQGEILGASIVGKEAEELIQLIALGMQQKIKIEAIAHLPAISTTFSEVLQQAAAQWQQHHQPFWHNFWESWFNWRRSGFF
jgi:pyruvate/2-oxoglutarate dehydrogenase complex dihydrolipoamide dehydrogenase (E3) component